MARRGACRVATGLAFASKYPAATVGIAVITTSLMVPVGCARRLQLFLLAAGGVILGISPGAPMTFLKPVTVWRDIVASIAAAITFSELVNWAQRGAHRWLRVGITLALLGGCVVSPGYSSFQLARRRMAHQDSRIQAIAWSHVGFQDSARRRHPGSIMITYRLKDNVVTHFPAIFKELGSKPSVIHMALDVELHGGVLVVRVAGGRPIDCGKCNRSTVMELARELIARKHRVVLVEEACGFGYSFHRQLREMGVEAFVVATESLNGKRKTNRRDAGKLLDQLYDFDVNGNKRALRPIRVPTLKEQKRPPLPDALSIN